MSMDRERRRAPRARYNNPIMLRVDVGTVFRGTSDDVSELGMGLSTDQPEDRTGQPLWLTFSLPRVPHVIQLKAQVVRQQRERDRTRLGVCFVEMPPAVRRMIRSYVFTGQGRIKDYEPTTTPA